MLLAGGFVSGHGFIRAAKVNKMIVALYSLLKNSTGKICNNGTALAGPIEPAE